MSDLEFLSEEEASRLWRRAAELQAEAARRAELPSGEPSADDASGDGPAEPGYALAHVRTAAIEAGIAPEFVDAALSDLRTERAVAPSRAGRFSRGVLKNPPDVVSARRVIEEAPADVLAAMEEILPKEPYRLSLVERRGDALDGGVLVFDIEGAGFATTSGGFATEAAHADFRQVLVALRPVEGAKPATEVTVRSPVAWAHRINAGVGVGLMTVLGGLGLLLGGGLGTALIGVGGPVLAGLATATVGGAGGVGGLAGIRALYRASIRRGRRALDGMLSAIAVEAEGGWGLSSGE